MASFSIYHRANLSTEIFQSMSPRSLCLSLSLARFPTPPHFQSGGSTFVVGSQGGNSVRLPCASRCCPVESCPEIKASLSWDLSIGHWGYPGIENSNKLTHSFSLFLLNQPTLTRTFPTVTWTSLQLVHQLLIVQCQVLNRFLITFVVFVFWFN